MIEENKEKKKTGIIRRILKWIGLGLLVALIIGALAFDAPWKVIALLFITLAAHTILPKGAVKWFWLSAAAVVVVLVIWIFLPDEDGHWRPYTFDEELAALEAKYSVPDEENAAVIYNQLLADYNENTIAPNLSDPNIIYLMRSEPWSSNDYPQVAEWLKGHENTIAKLIEASKFEKCRFPLVTSITDFSHYIKISAPMRRWAFLLVYAANNDIAEGRFDQAIEKNLTLLQMAKHVCQQPVIIDTLVGIAVEALATQQFNRFVVTGDATEERLNIIEQALVGIKHDWHSDFPRYLEVEKLMVKGSLCKSIFEINLRGKIRFSRDQCAGMKSQIERSLQNDEIQDPNIKKFWKNRLHPTYWQRKFFKAKIITYWFYMPSNPRTVTQIIDKSIEKFAFVDPTFDLPTSSKEFYLPSLRKYGFNYQRMIEHMIEMLIGAYHSFHDTYLRAIAEQRGARIIIALRRYKNKTGHWPESLEEVKLFAPAEIFIDPINGSSFVYKLTEEDFTLYSKGKNNIDEGGKRDRWDEEKTGADDWLIWPQKSRRTKEENTNAEQQ